MRSGFEMTYEVLARKWRPQGFQDVVGQNHVVQTLINAIKTNRLAHAYLFAGPRGVGKTSVARILAKAINCETGEPGNPCNNCRSCKEITIGSSVDVQEIDGASNRGIDEIRELRENINYMPSAGRFRVYIIDEVHMLTLPAFNALLKTLEEPPPHVKFVFATTEPHKVPVTILSRCQRFDFKRIPLPKIVEHLQKICLREGIQAGSTGLSLIAREAEGGMRDAESLLDQVVSFSGMHVGDDQVIDILGIMDQETLFQASRSIVEGDQKKCLEIVDRIYKDGRDIKAFYRSLMDRFRDLLITLISTDGSLLDMTENDREEARRQAEKAGQEKLQIILNFLIRHEEALRFTTHPRLMLETTMLQLCRMGDFLSFGRILERVEALESRLSANPSPPAPPVGTILADPPADWQMQRDADKPSPPERGPGRDGEWDAFLTFLSPKNRVMAKVLDGWRFLRLTGDTLELMQGNQSFSAAYFDDPEKMDLLKTYCGEFFGRRLNIKVLKGKNVQVSETHRPRGTTRRATVPSREDLPPSVQEIMDMFHGEIRNDSRRDPSSDR